MIKSKKWSTTRKWEIGKEEQKFIDLLNQNGYEIEGVKEYVSKTHYLITKNEVEFVFVFYHDSTGEKEYNALVIFYDIQCFFSTAVLAKKNIRKGETMKPIKCKPRENPKYIINMSEFEKELGIYDGVKRIVGLKSELVEGKKAAKLDQKELYDLAESRSKFLYLGTYERYYSDWVKQGRKLTTQITKKKEYVEYYYVPEVEQYLMYIINNDVLIAVAIAKKGNLIQ